jgi:hypothetical protein
MKLCIGVLVLAVASGCSRKDEGKAEEKWTIGGVELPASVVPPTVDFPTVFPTKIGDTMVDSTLTLERSQPGVRLFYEGEDPANARKVTGWVIRFERDPVPDLTKKWGAPTPGPTSGPGISTSTERNDCWEAPARHVKACVVKLREKTFLDLVFTSLS